MTYEDFAQEWDSRDMITCRTSGSTGAPKEILLPKQEMVNSALRTIDFFGLTGDSLLYSCIAPDFIGGKMMLVRQRAAGCRFLWETPSIDGLFLVRRRSRAGQGCFLFCHAAVPPDSSIDRL